MGFNGVLDASWDLPLENHVKQNLDQERNGVKLVSLTDWIEVCLSLELDEVMESLVHPGTEIKGIVETGKTIGSKQCGTLEFGGPALPSILESSGVPNLWYNSFKHVDNELN
ncbi:hypothetical protein HN51_011192 [Arachis hypogaea]